MVLQADICYMKDAEKNLTESTRRSAAQSRHDRSMHSLLSEEKTASADDPFLYSPPTTTTPLPCQLH